jgi:hypothetical protein
LTERVKIVYLVNICTGINTFSSLPACACLHILNFIEQPSYDLAIEEEEQKDLLKLEHKVHLL